MRAAYVRSNQWQTTHRSRYPFPDPRGQSDHGTLDGAPGFAARSLRLRRAGQDAVPDWQALPCTGPAGVFG